MSTRIMELQMDYIKIMMDLKTIFILFFIEDIKRKICILKIC